MDKMKIHELIEITIENLKTDFKMPCLLLYRDGKLFMVEHTDVGIHQHMKIGEIGCFISVTPSTPQDLYKVAIQKCADIQDKNHVKFTMEDAQYFFDYWLKEEKIDEIRQDDMEDYCKLRNVWSYVKYLSKCPDYTDGGAEGFFWGNPIREVIPFIEKYQKLVLKNEE